MTRRETSIVQLQASVLDWCSLDKVAAFESGSTTTDFSAEIAAAALECGANIELCFPAGTYGVASPINITTNLRMRSVNGVLKALNSLDTVGDGRGAILTFNQVVPTIDGLGFDLNAQSCNAVFVASCRRPRFLGVGAGNIKAGYAGIRAGSVLYGAILDCNFSGAGRAFDFQKGWELRNAMAGSPTLTFVSAGAGAGGTITRSAGSWITDGYSVSDRIRVELAATSTNNSEFIVTGRTATVLTFTAGTLANEGPTSGCVVSIVSSSYYGYHAGTISRGVFVCNEGMRLQGFTKLEHNDHEHGVYQPATRNENTSVVGAPLCGAIVLGEELSRSDLTAHTYEITGVYMELDEGTVGKERAIASNNGAVVAFNGGLIYGKVGPAAGSTAFYNIISGNGTSGGMAITINRWENGFEGQYFGNGGHDGGMDLTRVQMANVTTPFKAGTGVQPDEGSRSAGTWFDSCITHEVGLSQAHNTRYVYQQLLPSKAPANISFANSRRYSLTGTGTLDTDYFVTITGGGFPIGGELQLTFAAGSTWTVDSTSGKSLKLVGGANRLFLAGETLTLIVDIAGAIREKGHA